MKVIKISQSEEQGNLFEDYSGNLFEDLENFKYTIPNFGENQFEKILKDYNVGIRNIEFPTGKSLRIAEVPTALVPSNMIENRHSFYNNNNIPFVITDDFELVSAADFVSSVGEYGIDEYYPEEDKNKIFWNDEVDEDTVLYHATKPENISSIKKSGLGVRSGSRGFSNRYMPDAIFASFNIDATEAYGSAVVEILAGKMKSSGYMPKVSGEGPLESYHLIDALAHAIGLNDYVQDMEPGIEEDTVAFYGNIPPQFLRIIEKENYDV